MFQGGSGILPSTSSIVTSGLHAMRQGAAPLAHVGDTAKASTKPLNVLIMSADMAGGHDALAYALEAEILLRYPGTRTKVIGGLREANSAAYSAMRSTLMGQMEHAPASYGAMYPAITSRPGVFALRRAAYSTYGSGMQKVVAKEKPDLIVSTFPMITSVLGDLAKKGKISARFFAPIADSSAHALWFSPQATSHFVFNKGDVLRSAELATHHPSLKGMSVSHTRPSVDARFHGSPIERVKSRTEFGLPADGHVVLVTGGSMGLVLPTDDLFRLADESGMTVAVATGNNTRAADAIRAASTAKHDSRVVPIPYTKNMPGLIKTSDAIVGSAGGMTTYEAMTSGVPVLFHKPLPGHGMGSATAFSEDGVALYADSLSDLSSQLRDLVANGAGSDASRSAALAKKQLDEAPALSDAIMGAAALTS